MLAASARAEVQRRLGAIGVRRAVGATRGQVALAQALEGLLVAAPAATIGVARRRCSPPTRRQPAAGTAERATAAVGAGAPAARRMAGGGADAGRSARPGRPGEPPAGRSSGCCAGETSARRVSRRSGTTRGRRLTVSARRARSPRSGPRSSARGSSPPAARGSTATAVTLGLSTAFVLLMLALASALSALETDPGALGKRYQLTALAAAVRGVPSRAGSRASQAAAAALRGRSRGLVRSLARRST